MLYLGTKLGHSTHSIIRQVASLAQTIKQTTKKVIHCRTVRLYIGKCKQSASLSSMPFILKRW